MRSRRLRIIALLLAVAAAVPAVTWTVPSRVDTGAVPAHTGLNNAWSTQAYDHASEWPVFGLNVAHVIYWDEGDNCEVKFARSLDDGESWVDREVISDEGDENEAWLPALTAWGPDYDAHDVIAVYYDDDDDAYSIRKRRNTNCGEQNAWLARAAVTPGIGDWDEESYHPSATTCQEPGDTTDYYLHVVWDDCHDDLLRPVIWYDRTRYSQSAATGVALLRDAITSDDGYPDLAPSIAAVYVEGVGVADANYLHVVFYSRCAADPSHEEVWYIRSTNDGDNWSAPVNISNTTGYSSQAPCVAATGSYVYVVWQEEDPGDGRFRIKFRRSTNHGVTWGSDEVISDDLMAELDHNEPPECFTPSIACYDEFVYVVCQSGWDSPNTWYAVGFMMSDDHGATWATEGLSSLGTEDEPDIEDGFEGIMPSITVSKGTGGLDDKYLSIAFSAWDENDEYRVFWLGGARIYELPGSGGGQSRGTRGDRSAALDVRPNPVGRQAAIRVTLLREVQAELAAWDVSGKRVRVLGRGRLSAGGYNLTWDGTDDRGCRLPAGTYLLTLRADDAVSTRRVQLVND
jgi:hypothetical protein